MTLRDDVRDYFERESRLLPTPAGLRAEVAARAAEPPAGARSLRWAAVLAAVLAIAIVAGLLAASQLRRHQSVVPGRVHVAAGQIETLLSIDLVDPHHGWALIGTCDGANVACQYWVESYHDAAQGWFGATRVGPAYPGGSGDAPRYIHFANNNDGFVYGLGVAFETHDGGRSWSQMPGSFSDLIAIVGSTTLWMVLQPCVPPTQCPLVVRTSLNGGRTWSDAAPLPAGFQPDQVIDFSASGLLLGGPAKGDMAITKDGGLTWRSIPGRCSPGNPDSTVDTPDGNEIWELCGTTPIQVNVSDDAGATWSVKPPIIVTTAGYGLISVKPGVELLITSWEVNVSSKLLVSTDHGASWQEVPRGNGIVAIVFGLDGYGWAFDAGAKMYVTENYGLTWKPMSTAL